MAVATPVAQSRAIDPSSSAFWHLLDLLDDDVGRESLLPAATAIMAAGSTQITECYLDKAAYIFILYVSSLHNIVIDLNLCLLSA